MKKTIFAILALVVLFSVLAACGGGAKTEEAAPVQAAASSAAAAAPAEEAAAEATWEDYQNWLIDTFAGSSPDPEGFAELIRSFGSWEEIDTASQPWDKILGEENFNASTFDEFVAAGGVGAYNTEYVDTNDGTGEPPADGGASGEPTVEPS